MSYKAPLEDMNFLLNQVFKVQDILGEIDAFADFDNELYSAVLEEAAKFAENVLLPLNRSGDEEGCHFENGKVTTPQGFKQAYLNFCESGWQGTSGDPEYGGQGLPKTIHVLIEEMNYSANTSFCLYPSLTNGAYHAIKAHATEEMKRLYLPKMLEGKWSGAMGLTEPHAGSDLGIIKTKAIPLDNQTYQIHGTKIFITGGDHDLTDNIIHLVLAKVPNAPDGPKGISLFLVPKFLVNQNGTLGEANHVNCGSIEHKMGIKASATCVMNFDGAVGYLVGEENRGLVAMFTMMNLERLSIGIQGIGLAETAYQLAKDYSLERKQGRDQDGAAAAIIEHADVRRMLLEQRSFTEPARALAVFMGLQVDIQYHHSDKSVQAQADNLMSLLTPIAKAFFTDKGFEACNHGVQVLGGHGYVREWGLEQLVRDAKIAQIYEGTNGIQAQDLLVRKVCLDKQDLISKLYEMIELELTINSTDPQITELKEKIAHSLLKHRSTTAWLKNNFAERYLEIQGGAVDYLHASGYLVFGWMWLKIMHSLAEHDDIGFVAKKRLAAKYYALHLLPKIGALCNKVEVGYESVMSADNELI